MAKKILVADDVPAIAHSVQMQLEDAGYQVVIAYNGEEAYAKTMEEKPDLIILDLKLPKMDGFEVLKKLRSHPSFKNTPVIVLSGYGYQWEMEKASALGANDYLVKPHKKDELLEKVRSLIGEP